MLMGSINQLGPGHPCVVNLSVFSQVATESMGFLVSGDGKIRGPSVFPIVSCPLHEVMWISYTFSQSSSTLLPPWLKPYSGSHLATGDCTENVWTTGGSWRSHEEVGVPPADKSGCPQSFCR